MKRIARILLLALGVAALLCGQVSALDMDDIEFEVGTGDYSAAMVIEWSAPEYYNNSYVTGPGSTVCYAWRYNFDDAVNGEDMFNAILAADSRLFAVVTSDDEYGKAVLALGYDVDGDGFGITYNGTTYTQNDFGADGLLVLNYSQSDYFNKTDPDDLYWGGWYGPNWELWNDDGSETFYEDPYRGTGTYWTGDAPYYWSGYHGEWEFSQTGISGMSIGNYSWMGWSVANGGLDYGTYPYTAGTIAWMQHKVAPGEPTSAPLHQ